MRRRFLLGGGEGGKKSFSKKDNNIDPLQSSSQQSSSSSSSSTSVPSSSFPFLNILNRRSFAAADGTNKKNADNLNNKNNYYSAAFINNNKNNDKYATIGGGGNTKQQQNKEIILTSKNEEIKEEEKIINLNGLRTSSAHSCSNNSSNISSSSPPLPPPRRSPLFQRFGRNNNNRPRSMGAPLLQQMGIKCTINNIRKNEDKKEEEAETAFLNVIEDFPVGSARLMSSGRCCQTQLTQNGENNNIKNNNQYNNITNRNSTGSTNSSQTSSGFESSKSASSHQLAQSNNVSSSSTTTNTNNNNNQIQQDIISSPPLPYQNEDNNINLNSPSSRLSSTTGSSSTATTQGGRSSAYFSLSDGLDLSSTGIGGELIENGTLTTILRKSSKTGKRGGGGCSRVNISEMLDKGIPEQEIFAEWLQRLCLSEYLALFLSQGYDLPTLARATPEDLTTLGITKPDDRKILVQDIQCWKNVKDSWPIEMNKETPISDWLTSIGLKQYIQQFESQGCLNVGDLEQLEAEDLEDMGVQKLGHSKRIWLALRKLRESRTSSKPKSTTNNNKLIQPNNIFPNTTLWPCSSNSSSSYSNIISSTATLRRTTQKNNLTTNNNENNLNEIPKFREIDQRENTNSIGRVHFRNSSFGVDPLPDRGPPRLNLYRTSQIIAQLPREPPELLDKEEDVEEELPYILGHIPPPPAPMPLLPISDFPPSTSSSNKGSFGYSSQSQPTTPRNVQKMFALNNQQNNYLNSQQISTTFLLNSSQNNIRKIEENNKKLILFNSQNNELIYGNNDERTAASAR